MPHATSAAADGDQRSRVTRARHTHIATGAREPSALAAAIFRFATGDVRSTRAPGASSRRTMHNTVASSGDVWATRWKRLQFPQQPLNPRRLRGDSAVRFSKFAGLKAARFVTRSLQRAWQQVAHILFSQVPLTLLTDLVERVRTRKQKSALASASLAVRDDRELDRLS